MKIKKVKIDLDFGSRQEYIEHVYWCTSMFYRRTVKVTVHLHDDENHNLLCMFVEADIITEINSILPCPARG